MSSQALKILSKSIQSNSLGGLLYGGFNAPPTPQNMGAFVSKLRFARVAQDVLSWRQVLEQAEDPILPRRVEMMRMYNDTVLNPYVAAVIERWKEMTMLRDYSVYSMKNGVRVESRDLTQQLTAQAWFRTYIEYVLEAYLWGYSLIELRDIVDDTFPNITITPRQNILPDGSPAANGLPNSGPMIISMVYNISGIDLTDGDPRIPLFNHWIPTPTNVGIKNCGYGLLYNVSLYEIHLRRLVEWNMDYAMMFVNPTRVGSTSKTGDERNKFEEFLNNSGPLPSILLDANQGDEFRYEQTKGEGTNWKTFGEMRNYLEGVISQMFFGHTDTMRSLPGKLGGMQAANKDGFNESLIEQAFNDKQTMMGNFTVNFIHTVLQPNLAKIGRLTGSKLLGGLLPEGYFFDLKNDKEYEERKRRLSAGLLLAGQGAKAMADAGYQVDVKDLADHVGFGLDKVLPAKENIVQKVDTQTIQEPKPSKEAEPTGYTN